MSPLFELITTMSALPFCFGGLSKAWIRGSALTVRFCTSCQAYFAYALVANVCICALRILAAETSSMAFVICLVLFIDLILRLISFVEGIIIIMQNVKCKSQNDIVILHFDFYIFNCLNSAIYLFNFSSTSSVSSFFTRIWFKSSLAFTSRYLWNRSSKSLTFSTGTSSRKGQGF